MRLDSGAFRLQNLILGHAARLDEERRARLAAENRVRELEAELERRQQP